jgi:hypothetical protein
MGSAYQTPKSETMQSKSDRCLISTTKVESLPSRPLSPKNMRSAYQTSKSESSVMGAMALCPYLYLDPLEDEFPGVSGDGSQTLPNNKKVSSDAPATKHNSTITADGSR